MWPDRTAGGSPPVHIVPALADAKLSGVTPWFRRPKPGDGSPPPEPAGEDAVPALDATLAETLARHFDGGYAEGRTAYPTCPPTSSSQGVSAWRREIRPTTVSSSSIHRYVPVTQPDGRGVCGSASAIV